jgi:hypothetical protein
MGAKATWDFLPPGEALVYHREKNISRQVEGGGLRVYGYLSLLIYYCIGNADPLNLYLNHHVSR